MYGTTDSLTQQKIQTVEQRNAEEQTHHHKTVDMEELYDGMAIQTGYRESPYWANRVSTAQNQLDELMRQQDAPKEYNQHNPSVNINELYNGMAIQTGQNAVHSEYWNNRVSAAQNQLDEIMRKSEEPPVYNQKNPSVDTAELYNGMAIQTGYEHHSRNFYANE